MTPILVEAMQLELELNSDPGTEPDAHLDADYHGHSFTAPVRTRGECLELIGRDYQQQYFTRAGATYDIRAPIATALIDSGNLILDILPSYLVEQANITRICSLAKRKPSELSVWKADYHALAR